MLAAGFSERVSARARAVDRLLTLTVLHQACAELVISTMISWKLLPQLAALRSFLKWASSLSGFAGRLCGHGLTTSKCDRLCGLRLRP